MRMRIFVALLAIALLVVGAVLAARDAISAACQPGYRVNGHPTVIDGDTLELGRWRIRLQGVAAPELGDPGGDAAAGTLRDLLVANTVTCVFDGTRTHDRCVAICYLGGEIAGRDIGRELVRSGFARDCPRFSIGRYASDEIAARLDGHLISDAYPLPTYCRRQP